MSYAGEIFGRGHAAHSRGCRIVSRSCGRVGTDTRIRRHSAHHHRSMTRTPRLGRSLGSPCALCQVMLIESLPDQCLDDRLTAHIEVLSSLIQFLQHAGSDVYVHALNRLNHAALALEEMGNFLAAVG